MLDHVHPARFWAHAPSLAGRIDAASLRALQRMAAQAQGRPASIAEHALCLLFDRARFHPGIDLFLFLTPLAPATVVVATCGSSAEAREAAVRHLRRVLPDPGAKHLVRLMQLRFELTPEPPFAAWLPEKPSAADEKPAGAA